MATSSANAPAAVPRPKPKFQYKMFIAPAILMAGNYFKVDYKDPDVIAAVRVAYVFSQGLVLVALLYIAREIYEKVPEDKKKTLVKLNPTAKNPEPLYLSVNEYDKGQLHEHIKTFAISIVTSIVMHMYWTLLPALILQIVMQPMTMYEHGLFRSYVLKDAAVTRPFKDTSPGAALKDMFDPKGAAAAAAADASAAAALKAETEPATDEVPEEETSAMGGEAEVTTTDATTRHRNAGTK